MDAHALRLELLQAVRRLPADKLQQVADILRPLSQSVRATARTRQPDLVIDRQPPMKKDWPHAPLHRLSEHGTYMVTTGTYRRAHVFRTRDRLDLLESALLSTAAKYEWHLEAWSVFSNHYHFVGHSFSTPSNLRDFLTELHANTAREINRLDHTRGRQVWYNFWDKQLTYEKSYLARLNYVHQNAVKHGLAAVANAYPWCSAAWFERTATAAQVKTIYSFKTDRLQVFDEFEPLDITRGT
jgi:putative transposase